jgi:hypothetical protein
MAFAEEKEKISRQDNCLKKEHDNNKVDILNV